MENRRLNSITFNLFAVIAGIIGLVSVFRELGSRAIVYYTIDSNILSALACLLVFVFQISVVLGKKNEVPQWVVSLKYICTCLVTVTFIIVVAVLAPFDIISGLSAKEAYSNLMLKGSSLWLHFICPLTALITFTVFDPCLEKRGTRPVEALIPTEIYGVVLLFLNSNSTVDGPYPFLRIHHQTIQQSFIWLFTVIGAALLIAFLIYLWKKKAQNIRVKKTRMSFMYALAKVVYCPFVLKKNHVHIINEKKIDIRKGPVLLISNHCGAHDPVIVGSAMPRLVRWVAGAYLFKSPFFCFVFKYLAKCIPMQQGQSDVTAVRRMQQALKSGDVVGLFPEGTRTWDGDMVDFDTKPLAKMIRMFKVPTLFINIEGAYAMQPRWADTYRKGGNINIRYKALLSPQQISDMSVEEIQKSIEENLFFSNDAWKETTEYNFKSQTRAEGVQRLLYICPKCSRVGTLKAHGNEIECTRCNFKASLDGKDNVHCSDNQFTTLNQWHRWESEKVGRIYTFAKEKGVLLEVAPLGEQGFEKLSTDISVSFSYNVMRVSYKDAKNKRHALNFPFDKVSSLILNTKQTIELVMNATVYRIRLLPDSCSLKYHEKYLSLK